MMMVRRIALFLAVNILVVVTLSIVLNLFHVQPFLQSYGLDMRSLMLFCFIWGMGGAVISLFLSKPMAKWIMGVRLIDPSTDKASEQQLLRVVSYLAKKAGLSKIPDVGIFSSNEPNAFATGATKRNSLVAVSSGLLNRMSPEEVEGVIAHELAHIANGDMVTMTLLQGVVNAFVMFLARILAYAASGLGKSRNEGSSGSYGSYMLFVLLFEVVFMVLGSLVVCAYSRFREFRADKGGAAIAGKEKMISALESLQRMKQIHDPALDKPSMAAFQISSHKKGGWLHLFATHPPLEERIRKLQQG
ncbi:MAG: protease HtpX [Chlamydiota bacterium]|jgi:heat shock protein HtpX